MCTFVTYLDILQYSICLLYHLLTVACPDILLTSSLQTLVCYLSVAEVVISLAKNSFTWLLPKVYC